MIVGFKDKETERLWHGGRSRFGPDLVERALIKLRLLDAATLIDDLRRVPGIRLEALAGDRQDYWSLRINQQWRPVFRWDIKEGNAHDVEIVDCH